MPVVARLAEEGNRMMPELSATVTLWAPASRTSRTTAATTFGLVVEGGGRSLTTFGLIKTRLPRRSSRPMPPIRLSPACSMAGGRSEERRVGREWGGGWGGWVDQEG